MVTLAKARDKSDDKIQPDIAIPVYGYKSHISTEIRNGIIGRQIVLSVRRLTTAPDCARASSTRTTTPHRFGPTPLIAPGPTRTICNSTAKLAASTKRNRRASPCRPISNTAMPPNRRSERMSNRSSRNRKVKWAYSFAPSVSLGTNSRSPWPTSLTICGDGAGSIGNSREDSEWRGE